MRFVLLAILPMFLLTGCFGEVNMAEERAGWVKDISHEIVFGIAGPKQLIDTTDFMEGINLALEEVNAQGGAAGRQLKVELGDDESTFIIGSTVAQSFANDPRVMAIIGHWHTHITLPASTIYENAGVVMLSPVVSNTELCQRDYQYVFQNIPSDAQIGKQMALYADQRRYKNIVIYYSNTPYGLGLANAFEDVAREKGIRIVDRINGFIDSNEFKRSMDKWEALDYDAVFVAGSMPDGGLFIQELKKHRRDIPILGGDGLDFDFIETLGQDAEGVVLATIFNPTDPKSSVQDFIKKFEQKYHKKPDVWAIQGYDSIQLLAYAINKADSPLPADIAATLRATKDWQSVGDSIGFNEDGTITDKAVFKKAVRNGQFDYLPEN
ncbi:ABC transporter substrate-binding protein [Desulfotomaculum sp. 1211_IL3151]|uniref:ABC transporter substrate-binding protein n=1 Tax=Desulfotomaculum sp. 1211_IL3151 TaxID=3084055 RepID=UPI002FDB8628